MNLTKYQRKILRYLAGGGNLVFDKDHFLWFDSASQATFDAKSCRKLEISGLIEAPHVTDHFATFALTEDGWRAVADSISERMVA